MNLPRWDEIDWRDPKQPISRYFTVKEAIWLPSWNRLAKEKDELNDEAKAALTFFFQEKMDTIRGFIGLPVQIHVAFRPEAYNDYIHGAKQSAHIARAMDLDGVRHLIAAADWSAEVEGEFPGESCDTLRAVLMPFLEKLGIRMEDNGYGAAWIHNDTHPVLLAGRRYFKPE